MVISALNVERTVSHRSLQVINEVKCVIRELVENAIDAGASSILVKLVDNGTTAIHVTDNGKGIHESNFELLALPNTTSKIQKFEDIFTSLTSHGFRGEALSAIANVSALEVQTRLADEDTGWSLQFGPDGALLNKTQMATNVGTTVICRNLFEPYPVRRNMMLKGIKTSIAGSVSMVQQYALIHPDIKFSLTNVTSSSNQMRSLFTSPGTCKTIREVAEEIFGHNFIKNVVDVDMHAEGWRIEGVISTPQTGRQSNDIQILFVNSRPVDEMKRIKRCLKEVHRQFSSKNNVAYVLNLIIDYNNVDINLAPDKRRLFLLQEDMIMQQLKEHFVELYLMTMAKVSLISDPLQLKQMQFGDSCNSADIKAMEQLDVHTDSPNDTVEVRKKEQTYGTDVMGLSTGKSQLEGIPNTNAGALLPQPTRSDKTDSTSQQPDKTDKFIDSCSSKGHMGSQNRTARVESKGDSSGFGLASIVNSMPSAEQRHATDNKASFGSPDKSLKSTHMDLRAFFRDANCDLAASMGKEGKPFESRTNRHVAGVERMHNGTDDIAKEYMGHLDQMKLENLVDSNLTAWAYAENQGDGKEHKSGMPTPTDRNGIESYHKGLLGTVKHADDETMVSPSHKHRHLAHKSHSQDTDQASQQCCLETCHRTDGKDISVQVDTDTPKTGIIPPLDEEEICNDEVLTIDMSRLYDDNLCTVIGERTTKSNFYSTRVPTLTDYGMMDPKVFLKMKVCGQFNNGFIVAKLAGTELDTEEIKYSLYLIDPHAADEKTKFELYNDIVKIVKQPLVCPRRVDISPFHQQVVETNLELLKENGFDAYLVHKTENTEETNINAQEPGVYLTSLPQLLGHILGEEDFISFVHDLAKSGTSTQTALNNTDAYNVLWGGKDILPRPSRIWNILASKACKKAVKLGEPLSMNQMETIKDGLANLIHPWNCPHGRPTMKCLITTEQLRGIIK